MQYLCPFRSKPDEAIGCTKNCAIFDEENKICSFYTLAKAIEEINNRQKEDAENQE